ncbi:MULTISPECIES: hypothetical protein [Streptomyces]|uniref:Barstar (barnase inhibitor) domain-containing protein n=1 Tax=Streptomyces venezuelae TaxID=54571 RepID=A0A5P2AW95_STRVZ|nr:hypothetical protein [Streptomyces venezuelae]QES20469.1 hypothetical protein DEJ46_16185 [Streptomyces venezuelae]
MQHPRYALVPAPGDPARHVLALCKDVEGLFAAPARPARIRYELRGCEPRGALSRAVTQAVVEGTAPFGRLVVDLHGTGWALADTRVLGMRGDVVTVEAAGEPHRVHHPPDAVPCGNLVRVVPAAPEEETHTDVTFVGCSPRGELRDALDAGAEEFREVRYQGLTRIGNHHHEGEAGRITGWDTSTRHRGLLDLTLSFPRTGLVPPATGEIWDLFWQARPIEPGTWKRFAAAARGEWLDRAAAHGSYGAPELVPGATYHLDGTDIVDEDSFRCALGEAVLGPGRCFRAGGAGAIGAAEIGAAAIGEELSGATVVWHRADVARTCLGVLPYRGNRPATFQALVDALTDAGVRLVLD